MIQEAVRRNDLEGLRRELLSTDWEPQRVRSELNTAITIACRSRNPVMVEALLGYGADVNAQTGDHKRTPLHTASPLGDIPIAELLLNNGAAVNARDDEGATPLYLASANGHVHLTELLLDRGADYTARSSASGFTPLSAACWYDRSDVAELLLDHGADINVRDQDGETPMHLVAQKGHGAVARLLLDRGAIIDARGGEHSFTPLNLASHTGHANVVGLLLNRGDEVDTRDGDGDTSLLLASRNGHQAVAELLLDFGADLLARTRDDGFSPLHLASQNGHVAVAELLLDRPLINADAEDNSGRTPLHLASMNGHFSVAQALLRPRTLLGFHYETKATVDAQTNERWTPLHLASMNGHSDVVELLLSEGADSAAIGGKDDSTPLHLAFLYGHADLSAILMARGRADITVTDRHGRTPLDVANLEVPDAEMQLRTRTNGITTTIKNNWIRITVAVVLIVLFIPLMLPVLRNQFAITRSAITGEITSKATPNCSQHYDGQELKFVAFFDAPAYSSLRGRPTDEAYVGFFTTEPSKGVLVPHLVGDTNIKHNASRNVKYSFERNFPIDLIDKDKSYQVECIGYYRTASTRSWSEKHIGAFTFSGAALGLGVTDPEAGLEPIVNLHSERTEIRLGKEAIELNLSIVHTILTDQELTTNLVFTVPSGWSLEFVDASDVVAQTCSGGQCNAVYKLAPGEHRAIFIRIRPNEAGEFDVPAVVEWTYGDNAQSQIHRIPVKVTN